MTSDAINRGFFEKLKVVLNTAVYDEIESHYDKNIYEIIIDLGDNIKLKSREQKNIEIQHIVTEKDIILIENSKCVDEFNKNNRSVLKGTLSRISRILDKDRNTVGFTIRIGRIIHKDFKNTNFENKNILVIGPPGVGKTTYLRELARHFANYLQKHTVVIDSCEEIVGCNTVKKYAIGNARKVEIPYNSDQAEVIMEVIRNHYPEVLVIDEIVSEDEVKSIKLSSQRGLNIVATVHAKDVASVLINPTLNSLLGKIKSVTIGDDRIRENNGSKISLEREYEPLFDCAVIIKDFDTYEILDNLKEEIDSLLLTKFELTSGKGSEINRKKLFNQGPRKY